MRKSVLLFIILFSVSSYGQDLLARQAPIDRKMKDTDSTFLQKIVNDAEETEKTNKVEIPIIVDNNEGWEWLNDEDHVFHNDSYPIKLSYYTYKSHPQYKVLFDEIALINGRRNEYAAYNNKGVLVRVGMITNQSSYDRVQIIEEVQDELLRQAYIKDYRNNKYNFKKENTKAQNYVKKELKLIPDYVTLKNFFQTYSETANRYLEQLKNDHSCDFINLLKCERLTNLSFKATFANESGEPSKTYKVTYVGKGTYKYSIVISELPIEQIDLSQYRSLIRDEIDANDYAIQAATAYYSKEYRYHKVKKGETIQSIARKCHTSVESLCRLNHISKTKRLIMGEILKYNSQQNETEVEEESISSQTQEVGKNIPLSDNDEESVNRIEQEDNKVFDVVEEMPQYPGGFSAFMDYLSKSIQYPVVAEENGVQGRVICSFIVDTDGSISDVTVVKSVDPSLDKEAKRILSSMPNWIPGKKNGIPVRVKYTTPVTFRLR